MVPPTQILLGFYTSTHLLSKSKTQPPALWKCSEMPEQPVVKMLLVTEVKWLQAKLSPHKSNIQKPILTPQNWI